MLTSSYTKSVTRRCLKHIHLRTRIKRLVRRTICFSKTEQMHDLVIGLFVNRMSLAFPSDKESTGLKHLLKKIISPLSGEKTILKLCLDEEKD